MLRFLLSWFLKGISLITGVRPFHIIGIACVGVRAENWVLGRVCEISLNCLVSILLGLDSGKKSVKEGGSLLHL